jgi:hypothetical protein
MRRCSGGRGENHVRFQRAAVVSRSRGEPGAAANDPSASWIEIPQCSVLPRNRSSAVACSRLESRPQRKVTAGVTRSGLTPNCMRRVLDGLSRMRLQRALMPRAAAKARRRPARRGRIDNEQGPYRHPQAEGTIPRHRRAQSRSGSAPARPTKTAAVGHAPAYSGW